MAAFLKRLAEKKIVDAATAVNATNAAQADNATNAAQAGNVTNADQADNASALEGLTAAELAPRAAFNSTDDAPDGADYSLQTQITAPTRGILLMTRGIEASKVTAFNNYMCFVNNIVSRVKILETGQSWDLT